MAALISHMLIIPLSKTHRASFRSKPIPPPPSYLTQNQKSTNLTVRNNNNNSSAATPSTASWREIHGENEWAGLLDPMDPTLRQDLLRYGEMAQACYDAFDFDPYSMYCGTCRFKPGNFFNALGMSHHGYTVTRFLYATTKMNLPSLFKKSHWPKMWSKHANWAGYVAVSDDATSEQLGRRDIAVVWRGSVSYLEWMADFVMIFLKPISHFLPCPDQAVKVEHGLLELYTDKKQNIDSCKFSAREQVLLEVEKLMKIYHNEELSITVTGHDLGSGLATLSAYDIAETRLNVKRDSHVVPVSVISFSGPRVGNGRFKERLEMLGVKVLRVVNVHDAIPTIPGFVFNEQRSPAAMKLAEDLPWSYMHVGVELVLDHKNSPFLNPNEDSALACAHNLEVLLHLIDGYHGKGQRFELATGRDPALVNKACEKTIAWFHQFDYRSM
ncbi:phospholipase A1-Igamma2, chloroplastic-like [Lotus japonicus]|uniref:phospholipase A1-Igamma2, chloroplastic-like n=1 Tax=Lotus japonicus TaxID=34305 RepID=UPI002584A7F3|nr:phospholipase A1-Igamma2, chloroplastic-like [Lotus japonicus]